MEKKWDTVIPADLKRLFVRHVCPTGHERVKSTQTCFGVLKPSSGSSKVLSIKVMNYCNDKITTYCSIVSFQ